jgi:hypothetical protein
MLKPSSPEGVSLRCTFYKDGLYDQFKKGMFMKIRLLRSNSLGYAGTIRNTYHHAQKLLPYVLQVSADVQKWDYVEWLQAHNTHVFVTKDNRKIVLRPIHANKSYVGISIELSSNIRCAAGKGLLVANIMDGIDTPEYFSQIMKSLSAIPVESNSAEKENDLFNDNEDENGEIPEDMPEKGIL